MIDLWPQQIKAVKQTPPVAILNQQAKLLATKTQNLVKAEVERDSNSNEDLFVYTFYLVAPKLKNYRYRLFSIQHGVEFYPATVAIEEQLANELGIHQARAVNGASAAQLTLRSVFPNLSLEVFSRIPVNNEEELQTMLGLILGSQKTMSAVSSLMAHVQAK